MDITFYIQHGNGYNEHLLDRDQGPLPQIGAWVQVSSSPSGNINAEVVSIDYHYVFGDQSLDSYNVYLSCSDCKRGGCEHES